MKRLREIWGGLSTRERVAAVATLALVLAGSVPGSERLGGLL